MWMLLHGFTGGPRSWSRVVACAGLDQPPAIPTLAGHGRDWQGRGTESFESEVTRLALLIANAERPRLLCGYSMGARLALGLLAREPGLFDAAVLIGVHPGLSDTAERAERRELDAERARLLRENGLSAFVADWEELPLFASQRALSPDVRAEQRAVRLAHDAEGLARGLEALGLGEMPDYREAMASLQIPITIMTGSLDAKFSDIARALAAQDANTGAEWIDGVGHNVVLEAPDAVAAVLKRVEERARR